MKKVHEMFPYLRVADAGAAIEFYVRAFGAREKFRLTEPSGRIGHAELDFDGLTLMLSDAFPEHGIRSPSTIGDTSVSIHLHVDNADAMVDRAVSLGATVKMACVDHFYGERSGSICDPFGHSWLIGHSIEDVAPDEMQRRYTEMLNGS